MSGPDLSNARIISRPEGPDLSNAVIISKPDLSIGTENTWSDIYRSFGELKKYFTGEYNPVENPETPELTDASVPFKDSIISEFKMKMARDPMGQAKILAKHFEGDDRFGGVSQDANGHVMIEWDGKPYYVNKPGFSEQDMSNFVAEVVQTLPVTKLSGIFGGGKTRAAATFLGETLTEMGRQKVSGELGSGEEVDPLAAGVQGAIGAGADVLASKAGTAFGTRGQKKAIANETIPKTKGQRTGDIKQLRDEEAMRQGARGDAAEGIFRKFDDEQMRAIESEAGKVQKNVGQGTGFDPEGLPNIGNDLQQATIKAKENAKAAVDALYKEAREGGPLVMSGDGLKEFAKRAREAVADFDVEGPGFIPLKRFLGRIDKLAKGKTVKDADWTTIEALRKHIANSIGRNADQPVDAALVKLKGELDAFVDEALERGLLTGDENVLKAFQRARAEHSQYRQLFGSRTSPEPAAREMYKLLDEAQATPEQFIGAIVGYGKTMSTAKARGVVQRMVNIFGKDSPEVGLLKDAFLAKAFTNNGKMTRSSIVNNVNNMFDVRAKFLASELFSPEEIKVIKDYAADVGKTITPADAMNTSRSGWEVLRGMESYWRRGLLNNVGRIFTPVPMLDQVGDAFAEAGGSSVAKSAIRARPKLADTPLIGIFGPGVRAGAITGAQTINEEARQ